MWDSHVYFLVDIIPVLVLAFRDYSQTDPSSDIQQGIHKQYKQILAFIFSGARTLEHFVQLRLGIVGTLPKRPNP